MGKKRLLRGSSKKCPFSGNVHIFWYMDKNRLLQTDLNITTIFSKCWNFWTSSSFYFYPRSHGGHRASITPVFQRIRLWANAFNSFQLLAMIFESRATVLLHVSRGQPGSLPALIKGFHSIAFLAIHFSSGVSHEHPQIPYWLPVEDPH